MNYLYLSPASYNFIKCELATCNVGVSVKILSILMIEKGRGVICC